MRMVLSKKSLLLSVLSFFVVAFGQPAWSPLLGLVSACVGYGVFWISIISLKEYWPRFWAGTIWFMLVQMVQYSWALTHPYSYIYPMWFTLCLLMGMQFGLVVGWMREERAKKIPYLFFFTAFWTIMEWSRLFFLSGLSWNPMGLTLTSWVIPMQMASIMGIFGLSFWVFLTNAFCYRCYIVWKSTNYKHIPLWKSQALGLFVIAAMTPYVFGGIHYGIHLPYLEASKQPGEMVKVLLVQPAFQVEEAMEPKNPQDTLFEVYSKWKHLITLVSKGYRDDVDLVVLPEYVVTFGTYYPVFPIDVVNKEFQKLFGKEVLEKLPERDIHLAAPIETEHGELWMVNNAYWMQSISNIFDAEVVAGLEDTEEFLDRPKESYSSAMVVFPKSNKVERYEKRVLVPLGEYIPFEFCREYASRYGILGGFTPGTCAKVIPGKTIPYGLSICYEETFGHVMRDNRVSGAEMLVNLTNDFWYPHSRLPQQHFYHSRLRAVEMGIPLVRSTNTGVTGAVDSLGNVIDLLGQDTEDPELVADTLFVEVPRYHYRTIYTYTGDLWLIIPCWIIIFYFFGRHRLNFR